MDPIDDARLATPMWADFMEQALADQPPTLFPVPDGVQSVYIDPATERLATAHCPNQTLVYFAKGTEPVDYCAEHGPSDSGGKDERGEGTKQRSFWQRLFNR